MASACIGHQRGDIGQRELWSQEVAGKALRKFVRPFVLASYARVRHA